MTRMSRRNRTKESKGPIDRSVMEAVAAAVAEQRSEPATYTEKRRHDIRYISNRKGLDGFADRFVAAMEKDRKSRRQVARESGLSVDIVSRYAKGTARPKEENLSKLAAVFGVGKADLFPDFESVLRGKSGTEFAVDGYETVSGPDSNVVRLRADCMVSAPVGAAIIQLLRADDIANRR